MALGRLPPAHLAACGCTQIGQIWIGSAALVPKQDRRQNGGSASGYQPGATSDGDADPYEEYMREMAMPGYTNVPGHRTLLMLRRPRGDGSSGLTARGPGGRTERC
jgi:hypothetical protein